MYVGITGTGNESLACVRACVRACVHGLRASVRACVHGLRASVRACVRAMYLLTLPLMLLLTPRMSYHINS